MAASSKVQPERVRGSVPQQHEVTGRRATYQDVLDAPPHKIAEVVDGKLHVTPLLGPVPGRARGCVMGIIARAYDRYKDDSTQRDNWWILHGPEIHFGLAPEEDILVPDVCGWRRERMPTYPDVAYFTVAPDWVCEVLTPATRDLDLGAKRNVYAREGIPHLWLIDPEQRTLEAYERRVGKWALLGTATEAAPVSLTPFADISFPLNELWWPTPKGKASR